MSGSRPELRLGWCSYDAANFAVTHWHYSERMPSGKNASVGVWEGGEFIGSVIFGRGAGPQAHMPFEVERTEVAELVRVALREHETPVSRIVAIAIRLLRKSSPGLRVLVSFADPAEGHHGGIYQAMNWVYLGIVPGNLYQVEGGKKTVHEKTLRTGRPGYATQLREAGLIRKIKAPKFKYALPLDEPMADFLEPLRKPYPKQEDLPAVLGEGG